MLEQLNTHRGHVARQQRSAGPAGPTVGFGFFARSAPSRLPQLHKHEEGGHGGGGGEDDEEEVDECVHAREQNTGGRTSAGGGQKKLRGLGLKAE